MEEQKGEGMNHSNGSMEMLQGNTGLCTITERKKKTKTKLNIFSWREETPKTMESHDIRFARLFSSVK